MNILVVAATEMEIEPLLNELKVHKVYTSKYMDIQLSTLITGIGMVATAYALGKELAKNKYDLAINAGIAGSYNRNINIGEVVNVTNDSIYEMGAEDGNDFIPFHKLGIERLSETNTSYQLSAISYKQENKTVSSLRKVKGITVNTINGNDENINKIIKDCNPDIETMEGAAFIYACTQAKLPCFQIRSISNYVEKRNTENWNIKLAIENLNKTILEIIKQIMNND